MTSLTAMSDFGFVEAKSQRRLSEIEESKSKKSEGENFSQGNKRRNKKETWRLIFLPRIKDFEDDTQGKIDCVLCLSPGQKKGANMTCPAKKANSNFWVILSIGDEIPDDGEDYEFMA